MSVAGIRVGGAALRLNRLSSGLKCGQRACLRSARPFQTGLGFEAVTSRLSFPLSPVQLRSQQELSKRHWSISAAEVGSQGNSWRDIFAGCAKALAGLALGVLLLLAALPSILSTAKGQQLGCLVASRYLPGNIKIETADLGWNKNVRLGGVSLESPKILGRETLASAASIRSSASLWDILRGKPYDVFAETAWLDSSLSPSGQLKWGQLLDYEAGRMTGSQIQQWDTRQPDLVSETEEVAFTAEGRFLAASLYTGGLMKIPREVKEVIGQDLHLAAVVGASNLEDAAEDLGLDTSWLSGSRSTQTSQATAAESRGKRDELPQTAGDMASKGEPTMLSIRSEHMEVEASGWRLPNGDLVLRRPATAVLDFTPALAEYGLGRLSPLLSGVLAVEEGKVAVTLTPELLTMPTDSYHVRVEPLRIAVNRQDLLAKAIEFMRLKEGGDISQKALLQGMTSAINVDIAKDGSIDTHRVDLLVSADGGKHGVHLCTWGSVNPVSNEVDVSLGIPSSALAMIGLKSSKKSDMLVIPVSGKSANLRVNWTEAYKRLASLAAQQPGKTNSLRGKLLHGVVQALDMRANAPGLSSDWEAPEPPETLPWHQHDNLLSGNVEVDESTVKLPDD